MKKSQRAPIVAGITGMTFVGGLALPQFSGTTPLWAETETATLQPLENRGVTFSDELWRGEFVDASFRIKNRPACGQGHAERQLVGGRPRRVTFLPGHQLHLPRQADHQRHDPGRRCRRGDD